MDLTTQETVIAMDPLESIEQAVLTAQYAYERDDLELHMAVPGSWRDHQIWFSYRPDLDVIHMFAALDLKAPDSRYKDVCELVARLNERLWIGHFEIWHEDGTLVFRHALTLPEAENVSVAQAATMI